MVRKRKKQSRAGGLNWEKEGLSWCICSRAVELWDNYTFCGTRGREHQKLPKCGRRLEVQCNLPSFTSLEGEVIRSVTKGLSK